MLIRPSLACRVSILAAALLGVTAMVQEAMATWSIVLVDVRTGEIGLASETCLAPFDLRALTPVVLVGKGAAVCQASGDFDGLRRPLIRAGFENGDTLPEILATVSGVSGHDSRQYGMVDTRGDVLSFTGGSTLPVASGGTGQVGDVLYAVQANIMVGACTVEEIIAAIEASPPDDLPAMLLAGMEAARATGGDSRCSCGTIPPSCGCPVVSFTKAGDIGFFIIARAGDTDDPVCNVDGCADGDYFLALNYAFASPSDPDPVLAMQSDVDVWRAGLVGRPDAVRSTVATTPMADGAQLTITLLDWAGDAVTDPTVTLSAIAGSPFAQVSSPSVIAPGVWTVDVQAVGGVGDVTIELVADDGVRPVILMPRPTVCIGDVTGGFASDCDGDDIADSCAIAAGLVADDNGNGVPDSCEVPFRRGDCNEDGVENIADPIFELAYLFLAGATPTCRSACDLDDDGALGIVDAVYGLSAWLAGGPRPPAPYPDCGSDPTGDVLDCSQFAGCP
ncbi:MAG: DUF1028 domain-containing protein [Planctomycetes bacterium]|nr:DUF1028 domain-containing protein [Planctomycetota bacterium]